MVVGDELEGTGTRRQIQFSLRCSFDIGGLTMSDLNNGLSICEVFLISRMTLRIATLSINASELRR